MNSSGKFTKKILKRGQKLVVDEADILNGSLYSSYHIKNTQYWIYSGNVVKKQKCHFQLIQQNHLSTCKERNINKTSFEDKKLILLAPWLRCISFSIFFNVSFSL